MNKYIFLLLSLYSHTLYASIKNNNPTDTLKEVLLSDEVVIYSTRSKDKTPMTFSLITNKEIETLNTGIDIPILLQFAPSIVSTSDAGIGIGYTGIRIRGSDNTRINVTINNIPLNDSESHGVFWVNTPDLISSIENIQIQRGVGSSTNGAGAFGGTINLQTNLFTQKNSVEVSNSIGSFASRKHTLILNTGNIYRHWNFETRLSSIASDGYIDRAFSKLYSYYASAGYRNNKLLIKAVTFGGKENTYQAWWGVPEARLKNDTDGILQVIQNNNYSPSQTENILHSGRTFNYYLYKNQTDNYQQNHYQNHTSYLFNPFITAHISLHYTYGTGYYEEWKENEYLQKYNLQLQDTSITHTDIVRQRWLENHFYGIVYNIQYTKNKWDIILGGGANQYKGTHFGKVIWAKNTGNNEINALYYLSPALKNDQNIYLKIHYSPWKKSLLYSDLQIRNIFYLTDGSTNDAKNISVKKEYLFLNPKIGITITLNNQSSLYTSFSVAQREPIRSDFLYADIIPNSEKLYDLEIGYKINFQNWKNEINFYFMNYENQLINTGDINDVGANIRTNTPQSYRLGIEYQGQYSFPKKFLLQYNITASVNKIIAFQEIIFDYDNYTKIEKKFTHTDISFSPSWIASFQGTYYPFKNAEIQILSKFVGKQYLDNTQNETRKISPYFVNDIRMGYTLYSKNIPSLYIGLIIHNILNTQYESNGYTFGYRTAGKHIQENYYYPQAGINFFATLSVKF